MDFTVLLPHYKAGKMSAYCLFKLFEHAVLGHYHIHVIVIDNSNPDPSIEYLRKMGDFVPLGSVLEFITPPPGRMQSHGIAFDLAMERVNTEYFITVESDSFPTVAYEGKSWFDYYGKLIGLNYDAAGSLLTLSGGQYMHPAGAMYKKSIWEEAKKWCDRTQYVYFPNIAQKDGFASHLMVHNDIVDRFCVFPKAFIPELNKDYLGKSPEEILQKAKDYEPVRGPFHNGMGSSQESYLTYRFRNITTEPQNLLSFTRPNDDVIYRMGFEPGQWLTYFMIWSGCKIQYIPTRTVWLPNRVNQQQEYTMMINNFKHLWGVSAYHECNVEELRDIIDFKKKEQDALYEKLIPEMKLA